MLACATSEDADITEFRIPRQIEHTSKTLLTKHKMIVYLRNLEDRILNAQSEGYPKKGFCLLRVVFLFVFLTDARLKFWYRRFLDKTSKNVGVFSLAFSIL